MANAAPPTTFESTEDHNLPQGTDGPTFLGHPLGLFLLFFVEMWERFSYYGMRGLLVLYLIQAVTGDEKGFNPGRGWSQHDASTLYGWYTGLAYLFPILGGIVADKLIGTHRSMLVGGILISIGHVILGISGIGAMAHTELGMAVFVMGLAVIVLGTGHFKPTVSVMVGQLYKQGDPRRESAFTIFYMGINLGAFISAFVCGTLGEKVGWHWGFASAAVGMIAGLLMYMYGKPRLLRDIGEAPRPNATGTAMAFLIASLVISAGFGALYYAGYSAKFTSLMTYLTVTNPAVGIGVMTFLGVGILVWMLTFIASNEPENRGPVISIFLFMIFNAFFWLAFEQAGSSLNVFTEQNTDRMLGGFEVPATWFQSVNAGFIFILAPLFAMMWTALTRLKLSPSQPMKIALGLIFLGVGYIFMVLAARGVVAPGAAKASMWLIVATYFWHTVGELCLSPTWLAYVTKAAPVKFMSLLMGIWFISSFIANLAGGLVAAQVERIEQGKLVLPWNLGGGQTNFYAGFVFVSIGVGVLVAIFTPLLKKLMRDPND